MEHLFGPDGCPWDKEQTHATLRPYLLEEAYELVDAIDRDDMPGLREEIGDILAQMFMLTTIANLDGSFTLEDAAQSANEKFVRRHPHVFGDEAASSPASAKVLNQRWDAIKAQERAAEARRALTTPSRAPSTPRRRPRRRSSVPNH